METTTQPRTLDPQTQQEASLYRAFCKDGERIYVAMVPHAWGKGLTFEQAKAECRRAAREAGVEPRPMKVVRMPQGAFSVCVNSVGCIVWHGWYGCGRDTSPEEVTK